MKQEELVIQYKLQDKYRIYHIDQRKWNSTWPARGATVTKEALTRRKPVQDAIKALDASQKTIIQAAEWYWPKLSQVFKHFGWEEARNGGSHYMLENKNIPSARPVAIKYNQKNGAINPSMIGIYTSQMGLKAPYSSSEISIDPRHPYAKDYAAMGFDVPGLDVSPKVVSWGSDPKVAIDAIDYAEVPAADMWKVSKYIAQLKNSKDVVVPAVLVVQVGDRYQTNNSALMEAAKQVGMTHVPIRQD
jgi:hypothetical protein